jgi:hypothetical protein
VAVGTTALGGDERHVQAALGLLSDWEQAPAGAQVEARNRLLTGLVATFVEVVAEKKLGLKVGSLYQAKTGEELPGLPEAGYAPEESQAFHATPPTEGRTIQVSDNLTITEKWDYAQVAGQWSIAVAACVPFYPPDCRECNLSCNPWTGVVYIAQTGNALNLRLSAGGQLSVAEAQLDHNSFSATFLASNRVSRTILNGTVNGNQIVGTVIMYPYGRETYGGKASMQMVRQ